MSQPNGSSEQAAEQHMYLTIVPDESPITCTTFSSRWQLHAPSNQAPGHILLAGQEVPSSINMISEFRALLAELLKLPGVAFVILGAYSECMFHVYHLHLTPQSDIMACTTATLANLGITVQYNTQQ